MSENLTNIEQCRVCPNRSRLSKVLATLANKNLVAQGCEGEVIVWHGLIHTQVVDKNAPSPPEMTWTRAVGSESTTRYSRTEWDSETVCGLDEIKPQSNEVSYVSGETIRINTDGKRLAAFISGDEQDIIDLRAMQGIASLLDDVSD